MSENGRSPAGPGWASKSGAHNPGPLFDLVQQHIHRLDGHFLFRLLNGGKVDARQRSGGDVVKSDEGQIPRDADMELVSRLQDAQCVGVRRGKDRCIVDGLCKQLLDHLISILDGGPGKVAVMEPGFQPNCRQARR